MLHRLVPALLALVLVSCTEADPGGFGTLPPGTSPPPAPSATGSPPSPDDAPVVAVSTPGYRYEPATLVLPAGQAVVLELTNTDDRPHALTVEELSLQMTANPGETVRLPVHAPDAGSFAMYCSFPGHRQAGHRGRIEVR